MKVNVTLEFDEKELGKQWMNPDNLASLLYSETSTKKELLKISNYADNQLTASEAIFGFCAWLTTREEKTVMGANEECGCVVERIREFCDKNNLKEPRDNYTDYFEMPV